MARYSFALTKVPFLFLEFKKACALFAEGYDLEEIRGQALEENLYQHKNHQVRLRWSREVSKRLECLDNYLIKLVTKANAEVGRFILLYAIMKIDELFFDFLYEVIQLKLLQRDLVLNKQEIEGFVHKKAVDNWSPESIQRLIRAYKMVLIESGLAQPKENHLELVIPYLPQELVDHLVEIGDERYVYAIGGGI